MKEAVTVGGTVAPVSGRNPGFSTFTVGGAELESEATWTLVLDNARC